jgi:MFS family permease
VCSPLAGWFADRSSSRRLPLLGGLVTLAGATVMLCLARTVALLVVGRLLQGFSAAIVWTVGQALLVDTVGQREIGQTLGWVSLSMSLGILVAPMLGGVVYERCGYYAVFYMAFALIALDIFLRLALIEKKLAQQWDMAENTSVEPQEVSSPEPSADVELVTRPEPAYYSATKDEEKSPVQITMDAPPEVPRTKLPPAFLLLKSRRLLAALWGCIIQGSLISAFDSVVPLFVQKVFHWDSLGGGLIFLAVVVPNFAAPAVGWVSDNYGSRWLAVGGFIFAIPFWVLLRLVTHDSLDQKVLFAALLVLIGIALTLIMPPLMAEITYVVEAKEKKNPGQFPSAYGSGYGLFVASFAAGTLIGPIWAGYVNEAAGWGTMSWTLGLFSIAGAVPCLIYTGGLITKSNAKTGDERAIGGPPALSRNTILDSAV